MGRKTTPTTLKIAKGTAQPCRTNPDEYQPGTADGLPTPPTYLSELARKEYYRVGRILLASKVLAEIDFALFAAYCQEMATYMYAEEELRVNGRVSYTDKGYPIVNPWNTIGKKALEKAISLGASFGITPAARPKISVPKPEEDKNPFAKLTKSA